MKKKQPVRLNKKETQFWEEDFYMKEIRGIPLEFVLITIIMICFFLLIILFLGPCTESGLVYNNNTLLNV